MSSIIRVHHSAKKRKKSIKTHFKNLGPKMKTCKAVKKRIRIVGSMKKRVIQNLSAVHKSNECGQADQYESVAPKYTHVKYKIKMRRACRRHNASGTKKAAKRTGAMKILGSASAKMIRKMIPYIKYVR